jgi:hypothetical protein
MLYSKKVDLLQLIYIEFQQRPGQLMPFHSLGMGISLQILLRVSMEPGSIFGTYHHFVL